VRISVFLLISVLSSLAAAQSDPQFYYNRGTDLATNRDLKGAIESFDEAIRLDPNLYYVYASRAAAKAELGNLKAALADYNSYQKNRCRIKFVG